jgi:tetratricopeptide (TPR) repeat protein
MRAAILFSLFMCLPCAGGAQGIEDAVASYHHGRFQQAAEILANLARKSPADTHLQLWLGKTFLKLRRWDDAVAHFKKAVDLAPQDGMNHLWLGRAYGRKAEHALIGLGPARSTRAEFETAARLAPDHAEIRFDLMAFYLEAPGFLGGGREKAEAQAREIARLSPRLGYVAQAEIHQDAKDWVRARDNLVLAAQKFPQDAQAHLDLAKFLMRTGDMAGAEASARKAVALDGESRDARMHLAAIHVELGRELPGALSALQALAAGPLTDQDPGFEEVYYWLGRAHLAQGRKADARKAFETSLGFDPDYARAQDALKRTRQLP